MFDRKTAVWRWARAGSIKRSFGFQPAVWRGLPAIPFYQRLNQLLAEHDLDRFVEGQCRRF
jgi:hypothetical protein